MKRVVLLALVAAMTLSFAGCGNKGEPADGQPSSAPSSTPSPTASVAPSAEPSNPGTQQPAAQEQGHAPQSNLTEEESKKLGDLLREYESGEFTEERKQELLKELQPLLEKVQ